MSKEYNLKISKDKTKIMAFKGKHLVRSKIEIDGSILQQVKQFNYLGCELSLDGAPDFDTKVKRFQRISSTIRKNLKKTRTDTQIKFYKVVARSLLLYGSETWVTTKRDMTGLEAAEMRFLRSVTGYTRLDKIRNEITREYYRSLDYKTGDSNTNKTGSTTLKEWTTPDSRNTPSTTYREEEEIVEAPGKDGNASMPEQVKRLNPWRKMMMMFCILDWGYKTNKTNVTKNNNYLNFVQIC